MQNPNDLDRKPVSSQKGRDWLVTTRRTFDGAELAPIRHHQLDAPESGMGQSHRVPKKNSRPEAADALPTSVLPVRNRVKITSVTIPDVSSIESLSPYLDDLAIANPINSENLLSNPKAVAKSLAEASDTRLGNLAKENNFVFLWQQKFETGESKSMPVPMEPIVTPIAAPIAKGSGSVFSDLDERPDSWVEKHDQRESDRVTAPPTQDDSAPAIQPANLQPTVAEAASTKSNLPSGVAASTTKNVLPNLAGEASEVDFSGVLDSILQRKISGESMVVQFVGTEWNRHVDATTATVASILCKRRLGSVLLIDSNAQSRSLTISSGETGKAGLADAATESIDWRTLIRKGSASGVDFLPFGKSEFENRVSSNRLRSLVAELKKVYDYICVSSGSSDSFEGHLWSEVSDGCYLLVSQTNSNQTLAQSAVAELQASGARLLGCVVTDTLG